MRAIFKERIVKLLYELRWTYTSARFISSTLSVEYGGSCNARRPLPSVMEIVGFLNFLKKKEILQTKIDDSGQTLYQLKEGYKLEEIEREV